MQNYNSNSWVLTENIRFDLKVDNEKALLRRTKCNQCEHLSKHKFCNQCGCFMPIKVWLKTSKCPISKW